MESKNKSVRWIALITYAAMVAVNALANLLPINGITTGAVADSYPNLFAPAGFTFAIWGLIYLLLGAYCLYQLGLFGGKQSQAGAALFDRIGPIFSVSSLLNIAWIFAWHNRIIPLSMLLTAGMFLCVLFIVQTIKCEALSRQDKIFLRFPFSVYFGWLTVATAANAAVLLVSLHWNGFGISEPVWTVIVLIVVMVIGAMTIVKNYDPAYGAVLIWAYTGIFVKHISPNGFANQYMAVEAILLICIMQLLSSTLNVLFRRKRAIWFMESLQKRFNATRK